MDVLVGELLEEVIQYLVRRNFFRRGSNGPRPSTTNTTTREVGRHQREGLDSQSSYDQRRRHRRQRHTESLMASLDRLSTELELTHDALVRVMHSPRNSHTDNEPLLANADDLRRTIDRSAWKNGPRRWRIIFKAEISNPFSVITVKRPSYGAYISRTSQGWAGWFLCSGQVQSEDIGSSPTAGVRRSLATVRKQSS
ncbi:hypothetical protein VM1G_11352 [Cytospora mali]|uniref:Uncharacterized protein n=1 Tax=Cytospora mali TaxID=578113 RepID=A0A194VKV5_CYTMA|nr:hypothetical protein VM1G_11352 [Valsa mali]